MVLKHAVFCTFTSTNDTYHQLFWTILSGIKKTIILNWLFKAHFAMQDLNFNRFINDFHNRNCFMSYDWNSVLIYCQNNYKKCGWKKEYNIQTLLSISLCKNQISFPSGRSCVDHINTIWLYRNTTWHWKNQSLAPKRISIRQCDIKRAPKSY